MKKQFQILFLFLLTILIASGLYAQDDKGNTQRQITGTVVDEQDEPLPGVTVMVKGTTQGTVTNINGVYSLQVQNENAILVFSFIGFTTKEVSASRVNNSKIILEEASKELSEVVVIGYGTVAKKDLTGSVSSVKQKDLTSYTVSNPIYALQGLVPGVHITQNTGDPTGDYTIRIRGINSIRGDNEPLYIIDGFPESAASISPHDIESLEVLKDASATSIYGSRGANGVVIITTKKGRAAKTQVSYNFEYGIQTPIKTFNLLDSQEFARYLNYVFTGTNAYPDGVFSESEISAMGKGTDWQALMYNDAPILNHNINISGGTENTKYNVSATALKRDGLLNNTSYEKYNIRSNLDFIISPMIDASLIIGYTNTIGLNQNTLSTVASGNGLFQAINSISPFWEPYDENGNYVDFRLKLDEWAIADNKRNPMNVVNENSNKTENNAMNINTSIVFNPLKGLYIKSMLGINFSNSRNDSYQTSKYLLGNNTASISDSRSNTIVNENTINYKFTINNLHKFDIVGGFTYQQAESKSVRASGYGFFSDILYTNSLGSASTFNSPSTGYSKWVLMSYLGRINYSYKGKYLATVNFRTDGSSRYSPGSRWGYFPSGAVAWRISDEQFMESTTNFLSDLKIRLGYGETGSTAISAYATQNLLYGGRTATGNGNQLNYAPSATYPGDLKWETTAQSNIGLDIGLFKQRVQITADYYEKNTYDLLNVVSLPASSGYTSTVKNIGNMSNKGIEFLVDADIVRKKDFGFNAQFNIARNKNKIVKLADGDDILGTTYTYNPASGAITILREGETMGAFYLYKYTGLDENGRLTYEDVDGDGQYTDNSDRYVAGSPHPDFTYGLNCGVRYKNWDFSFFLQGSKGNKVLNATMVNNYLTGSNVNRDLWEQSWKNGEDNSQAKYANFQSFGTVRYSTYLLEDGSYLRLKNICLAYNLPCTAWKTKNWLQGIRIYVSAQDFLTITKYTGLDPEVSSKGGDIDRSIDFNTFPSQKRISFGINVKF